MAELATGTEVQIRAHKVGEDITTEPDAAIRGKLGVVQAKVGCVDTQGRTHGIYRVLIEGTMWTVPEPWIEEDEAN